MKRKRSKPVLVDKGQSSESAIDREWRLFGSVLPASQLAPPTPGELGIVPGRGRTRYFYRKMAIAFAQDARRDEWIRGSRATFRNLALHYLAIYRALLAGEPPARATGSVALPLP